MPHLISGSIVCRVSLSPCLVSVSNTVLFKMPYGHFRNTETELSMFHHSMCCVDSHKSQSRNVLSSVCSPWHTTFALHKVSSWLPHHACMHAPIIPLENSCSQHSLNVYARLNGSREQVVLSGVLSWNCISISLLMQVGVPARKWQQVDRGSQKGTWTHTHSSHALNIHAFTHSILELTAVTIPKRLASKYEVWTVWRVP